MSFFGGNKGALPLPTGEGGVRGYGPSIVRCPLTRFAAQIDLSPSGRGEARCPYRFNQKPSRSYGGRLRSCRAIAIVAISAECRGRGTSSRPDHDRPRRASIHAVSDVARGRPCVLHIRIDLPQN